MDFDTGQHARLSKMGILNQYFNKFFNKGLGNPKLTG